MTSRNKKQKDLENKGRYKGTCPTRQMIQKAKDNLVEAKNVELQRVKDGYKWVKTFKGHKLVKV
jgi:hypothetical protein